jgi:hypothetical protein
VISNSVLISPPASEFDPYHNASTLSFVYKGYYEAYSIYLRASTLFLLSFTVILYICTIVYVYRDYRKVTPLGGAKASPAIKTIDIEMTEPGPSAQNQVKVGPGTPHVEQSNQMGAFKRKKVV